MQRGATADLIDQRYAAPNVLSFPQASCVPGSEDSAHRPGWNCGGFRQPRRSDTLSIERIRCSSCVRVILSSQQPTDRASQIDVRSLLRSCRSVKQTRRDALCDMRISAAAAYGQGMARRLGWLLLSSTSQRQGGLKLRSCFHRLTAYSYSLFFLSAGRKDRRATHRPRPAYSSFLVGDGALNLHSPSPSPPPLSRSRDFLLPTDPFSDDLGLR